MDILKYLQENKIKLTKSEQRLALLGIEKMKKSRDILHPVGHIERIFELYSRYKDKVTGRDFNESVFVLSVVWHDVWKAQYGTHGFILSVYAQIMEGILSAKLFRAASQPYHISKQVKKEVSYAIRKHSQFQILPLITSEARLLWDLDKLDKWDVRRVEGIKDSFFAFKNTFWKKLFILYMNAETDKGIHSVVLKEEFRNRKESYFRKIGLEQ